MKRMKGVEHVSHLDEFECPCGEGEIEWLPDRYSNEEFSGGCSACHHVYSASRAGWDITDVSDDDDE